MADDRAILKRDVARALRSAGERRLGPLGMQSTGRGARAWYADRGRWQLKVNFDPSGFSVATHLTVGLQYFWSLRDGLASRPDGSRQVVGGFGQQASFEGGDGPVDEVADAFAARAAEVALTIDQELGDPWLALERLSTVERSRHGLILGIDAVLFAHRLLDRTNRCSELVAEHRRALLADPHQHESWSRNASDRKRLDELEQLVTRCDARTAIGDRIDQGRALLNRAPMAPRPVFLLESAPEQRHTHRSSAADPTP